jgi:hypothetical protein
MKDATIRPATIANNPNLQVTSKEAAITNCLAIAIRKK